MLSKVLPLIIAITLSGSALATDDQIKEETTCGGTVDNGVHVTVQHTLHVSGRTVSIATLQERGGGYWSASAYNGQFEFNVKRRGFDGVYFMQLSKNEGHGNRYLFSVDWNPKENTSRLEHWTFSCTTVVPLPEPRIEGAL